jgi:hypothetical protein
MRYHIFYHEIYNDDSAEDERNSRGVGGPEMLYGCYGKTVEEEEEEMGPPAVL